VNEITARVAEFTVNTPADALPADLVARALDAIVDGAACLLAGYDTPVYQAIEATSTDATFWAGVAVHALDFDDSLHPATMHPTCVLLPVLLTADLDASGADLLAAYTVGLEAAARLADALGRQHYLAGWHTTGTVGTLAAAVASARLLGLTVDRTCHALALAASMAGGLRVNLGSEVKPVHAGLAASGGMLAARLAAAGVRGDPDALGRPLGFLDVFAEHADPTPLSTLGEHIGVGYHLGVKPYACCGEAIGAVEAALELSTKVDPSDVTSIEVGTNRISHEILRYPTPATESEARFSLQFCVARALATGEFPLRLDFPALRGDPSVARLAGIVDWSVDPAGAQQREFGADVTVRTRDGATLHHRVDTTIGWHERRLPRSVQRAKFLDCAAAPWADEVFDTITRLPEIDAATFASALARRPA
jgi:2-methylcitrate dehydratase PrpD